MHHDTDIIDRVGGLASGDALYTLRRERPDFVAGAETCRIAVLDPEVPLGLSPALRTALAHRMAALNGDDALVAQYKVAGDDPDLLALASGEAVLSEPLAAMARHCDLITLTPAQASAGDIARLQAAGLSNPQIVALSELIAFVNFQVRIAVGLRLMGTAR